MKYLYFVSAMLVAFSACTNTRKETARQDVEVLTRYVDSVETIPPTIYSQNHWEEIESGYNQRIAKLEAEMLNLDVTERERADAIKAKFAAIKAGYEIKLKEAQVDLLPVDETKLALRNSLFGGGKVGTDLNFQFVTPQNIVAVYDSFVNTLTTNKDTYTREEWDEIKILNEALDTRKSALEKELTTADNLKIAELKVRFAMIKASNRAAAKSNEENKQ